jgi:hypothetical protein
MARHPVPEVIATILPAAASKRQLPRNFDERDRSLFQHELEHDIPPTYLLKFHDVLVSAEGLIVKGLKLLPESFAYPFELDEWKRSSIAKLLATNYFLRRRRAIETEVLWITDYWSKGYFHWLTDALPRLFVMRERLDQLTLMLPWEFETREFVAASLDAFGVKNVDFIKQNEVLECRSLLMPTHTAPSGHFREETIRGVREILLSAFGKSQGQDTSDRIYITRRGAGKRRIANEEEIVPVLDRQGFQVICAEDLTFEQQVRLASQTRYLVSNHGAGLANMLFMPVGGRVFELRHRTDYVNNCYFVMSSALDLNYFYQLCEPQGQTDPHTADLIVNPQELERSLSRLLESEGFSG